MENSQTMRLTPGSPANSTSKRARSTCACSPGGVSKRTSTGSGITGLIAATVRFTAV